MGACVFAVQEPRAGGPEAWGTQDILHDGAQGASSLDPEDEEAEFTAPGTRRHRPGEGCLCTCPVTAVWCHQPSG